MIAPSPCMSRGPRRVRAPERAPLSQRPATSTTSLRILRVICAARAASERGDDHEGGVGPLDDVRSRV